VTGANSGGGEMKAIIVLLVGLLLLGGAAVGGWTLYTQFVQTKAEAPAEPPPPPKPGTAYVRIPNVNVPVIGENRVKQFISITVTLQVDDNRQQAIQGLMPRLQNAVLTKLYELAGSNKILSGSLVDIAGVKAALVEAMGPAIGGPGLQDVLIQAVMQRNL